MCKYSNVGGRAGMAVCPLLRISKYVSVVEPATGGGVESPTLFAVKFPRFAGRLAQLVNGLLSRVRFVTFGTAGEVDNEQLTRSRTITVGGTLSTWPERSVFLMNIKGPLKPGNCVIPQRSQ